MLDKIIGAAERALKAGLAKKGVNIRIKFPDHLDLSVRLQPGENGEADTVEINFGP